MKIFIKISGVLILGIFIGFEAGCQTNAPKSIDKNKNTEVLTISASPDLPELNRKAVNEILAKEGVSILFEDITVKDKELKGKVKSSWYDVTYEKRVDIASGLGRSWRAGRDMDMHLTMQFIDHLGSDAFTYGALSGLHVTR